MILYIPYDIGNKITINNETHTVNGIHVYIDKYGNPSNIRLHTSNGSFMTVKRSYITK